MSFRSVPLRTAGGASGGVSRADLPLAYANSDMWIGWSRGPTERHTGQSTFLLSSEEGGGVLLSGL